MNIQKRKLKNGTVKYRVKISIKSCQFTSQWFSKQSQAADWAAERRLKVLNGGELENKPIKLNEFAKIWLEKHVFANKVATAAVKDEQHLRLYVLPHLGDCKLNSIRNAQIEFLLSDLKLAARLKPKTINNILGTVKKMLNDAVRWEYVNSNPALHIRPLKISQQQVTYFYATEVRRLLSFSKEMDHELFQLITCALNTGCRLGECFAITWDKINFETGMVTIDSTYDYLSHKIVMRTKGKRFRQVPLNDSTATVLKKMSLEGRKMESKIVFGKLGYIAVTSCRFKGILEKAGMLEPLSRGATFHSLRHTFASEFMRSGGNIYELQNILGHSTIKQTEKYAHFAPNFLAGATERVVFSCDDGKVFSLEKNAEVKEDYGQIVAKTAGLC